MEENSKSLIITMKYPYKYTLFCLGFMLGLAVLGVVFRNTLGLEQAKVILLTILAGIIFIEIIKIGVKRYKVTLRQDEIVITPMFGAESDYFFDEIELKEENGILHVTTTDGKEIFTVNPEYEGADEMKRELIRRVA